MFPHKILLPFLCSFRSPFTFSYLCLSLGSFLAYVIVPSFARSLSLLLAHINGCFLVRSLSLLLALINSLLCSFSFSFARSIVSLHFPRFLLNATVALPSKKPENETSVFTFYFLAVKLRSNISKWAIKIAQWRV